jgi:hypothetical protein
LGGGASGSVIGSRCRCRQRGRLGMADGVAVGLAARDPNRVTSRRAACGDMRRHGCTPAAAASQADRADRVYINATGGRHGAGEGDRAPKAIHGRDAQRETGRAGRCYRRRAGDRRKRKIRRCGDYQVAHYPITVALDTPFDPEIINSQLTGVEYCEVDIKTTTPAPGVFAGEPVVTEYGRVGVNRGAD